MMDEAYYTGDAILDGVPPPYELPHEWTPEHVAHRMVEAFEILFAMGGRVGPRQHANGWPTILQEFADLIDEEAMKNARDAFAQARSRPSADEISRMDEALAWPIRFLPAEPKLSDAVLIWSMCKAGDFSIAGMLRARVIRAKAIAHRMQTEENGKRSAFRQEAAREAAAWANERLRDVTDPERVASIKGNAHIRFERAVADHLDIVVTPSQAMPGRILSRTSLDRYLPAGLNALAERLNAARVVVR